jgi:protein TonB
MWACTPVADARANLLVEVSVEPSNNPPEPEPVLEPQERPRAPAFARGSSPRSTRPSRLPAAPSPSASGEASTDPAPGPIAPVDFTGQLLVAASTGRAGGGSGTGAGDGARVGRGGGSNLEAGSAVGSGTGDRAGGVSLDDHNWACPWPHQADAEQIDEQTVIIKVVVNPDGTVASAAVVSDPGHGFGPAAIACALRTRFTPARDRDGRPIRAESPPVLVRFTR